MRPARNAFPATILIIVPPIPSWFVAVSLVLPNNLPAEARESPLDTAEIRNYMNVSG